MIDQPPAIPPAVVQFAEEHNIKNVQKDEVFYIKKTVFNYKDIKEAYFGISAETPQFQKQKDRIYTNCSYILVEKDQIRLATPEETEKLNQVICL